ncbi:MAG: minor capsid protein [Lachnospiraceae bacterium]|nr:minor capsid protein [Lachnospiraceae bacterium]
MSYWQKRQEAMYRAGEMKVNKYFTRLEKAFKQTQRELQKAIEAFYFRYAEENGLTYAAAQQKLDKMELGELQDFIELSIKHIGEYNQEVNNLSIKARITRYQALEAQIDAMLRKLYAVDYQTEAEKTMQEVYEDTYYQTWYNIDQYHGFHSTFAQVDPATVETLLEYPFNGANFSDRLWKQKDHLQTVLMESVTTMLVQGVPPHDLAGDIAKKMKTKTFDAYRLLHTEGSFLMSEATHAGYKEDGVEKYQLLATLDSKTCGICGELDGNTYPVEEAVAGKNMPPFHCFCRCTDVPYYDDMDLSDQTRVARDPETGKTYEVPADMTYKEWKAQFMNSAEAGRGQSRPKRVIDALSQEAEEIIDEYTDRKTKWSGKTIIDDEKCVKEKIAGRKLWSCDILLKSTASDKVIIHEHLHARSGSYLNPITIIPHSSMEEGSVEFLAREICRNEGILFKERHDSRVDALMRINAIMEIRPNNLDFAVLLFSKDVKSRYKWLKGRVDRYVSSNPDAELELYDLLEVLKGLKK